MKITSSFRRSALGLLALLLALVGGPRLARAEEATRCEDQPACRKLLEESRRLLDRGELEKARASFQAAFERSHDIKALVGLGRALQLLGRSSEALEAYSKYLEAASYQAPERPQVVEWVHALLATPVESPVPAPDDGEQLGSRPGTAAPGAVGVGAGAVPGPGSRCDESSRARVRPYKIAGGILLGVGALGLIPSGVLASMDGQPTGAGCDFDGNSTPCVHTTLAASVPGFALSGLTLTAGAVVLSLGLKKPARVETACAAR